MHRQVRFSSFSWPGSWSGLGWRAVDGLRTPWCPMWRAGNGALMPPGGASGSSGRVDRLCRRSQPLRFRKQASHADEVVGGGDQISCQPGPVQTAVARAPESTDGLHPAKDLLDPLADPLAHLIALVPGGSSVDGTSPTAGVLGYVWGDLALAHDLYAILRVVVLVPAQGLGAKPALLGALDQLRHRIPFGCTGGLRDLEIDQHAVAIFHQSVAHKHQLGFLALALAQQAGLRIRGALVRRVGALLTVEVHRRVARIIIGRLGWLPITRLEALEAGCRLDQSTVHGEMLIRQQSLRMGLAQDLVEQLLADRVLEEPLSVLREGGGVEAGLHHLHVQEPAEQKVVVEFLTEGPLAPHGVERDQQRGLQQSFGWNGRSSALGVHPIELCRQCRERCISEPPNGTQRMVLRDPLFQIDKGQHGYLALTLPSHYRLQHLAGLVVTQGRRCPVENRRSSCTPTFSAAC